MMRWIGLAVLVGILLVMAYVRLAPIRVGAYFALPSYEGPGDVTGERSFLAVRQITTTPEGVLRAVQAAAEATSRTRLLEGSVGQGRLVFVSRSILWGFPDFTTVGVEDGLLVIHARARFGHQDLGVNKARVENWLAQLGPLIVTPA